MVFLISQTNGCTYTLDPDHSAVLYYAPLLSDGTYETVFSAYSEVEWDELDDDVLTEADRCYSLLRAELNPLDNIMGGNPVDTIPSVSYTYTDTPMAEEYYGG